MADQMTPAEMRGFAFDLRLTADVMARHQQLGSSEIRAMRAGADALERLAAVLETPAEPVAYAMHDKHNEAIARLVPRDYMPTLLGSCEVRPLYAHPETPEPTEWEYAALDGHGRPLFRGGPFKNIGIRLTELAEEGWPIYRRPAPGPWEPVENTEEGQDA